jgi:hypothetical protein
VNSQDDQHTHFAKLHAVVDHPNPTRLLLRLLKNRDAISAIPVSHSITRWNRNVQFEAPVDDLENFGHCSKSDDHRKAAAQRNNSR